MTKFQPPGVLDASGVLDAAFAPEGREGRSQAGPKGHQLEIGARRAPKLPVQIEIPLKLQIQIHLLSHTSFIYTQLAKQPHILLPVRPKNS